MCSEHLQLPCIFGCSSLERLPPAVATPSTRPPNQSTCCNRAVTMSGIGTASRKQCADTPHTNPNATPPEVKQTLV